MKCSFNKSILLNSHPCGQPGYSPPLRALWSGCQKPDSTSPRRNWASLKLSACLSSSTSSRGHCSRPESPLVLSSSLQGCWRVGEEVVVARTCPRVSPRGPFPSAAPGSWPRGSTGLGSSGKDSKCCGKLPAGCRKSRQSLWLSCRWRKWLNTHINFAQLSIDIDNITIITIIRSFRSKIHASRLYFATLVEAYKSTLPETSS